MSPHKPRLTPEQEARYKEVCAARPLRPGIQTTNPRNTKDLNLEILSQVEIFTREYREHLSVDERAVVRNTLTRLSQKGLIVNTGTSQHPKWQRTDAGNALLRENHL